VRNPLDRGYYGSEELRSFGFKAVGENVRISRACNIVGPENIEIGSNVRIDAFTSIIAASGWVKLGDYIHIGTSCLLGARGGIEIAGFGGMSHGAKLVTASDDFSGDWMASCEVPARFTAPRVAPIRVGRHSVICMSAIVLGGATIPDGVVIGAHAFVNRSVMPWGVYGGIPAQRLKDRTRRVLELEAEMLGRLAAA
jgi:galactoside O-acetyltransferase